ncbi:P-loop NTPase fold protein [Acinetobacter sp. WCHAc010034]|uniref:P-loop NTPase fold protein n=1 Tax=Acinetobacter sp. WCHAc010034 TaxID=1879049 RepID=UPI00083B2FE4|nr:P-loop NTPase fold protein [Acinetobacter sp. WCHAc010034]
MDRCRPDFAIRLIERIKHFFDIKNIVFVLVMDKTQFSKVVCHNYGYDEKLGEEYLDKFIDFKVSLLPINKSLHNELVTIPVLKKLFEDVGEFSDDIVFIFYKVLDKYISPRDMRRKINLYALLKTGNVKKDMFLIISIISGPNDVIKKFRLLTSEIDQFIQVHKLSSQEIETYFKDYLSLRVIEFLDIFNKLKNIESTTYAYDGGIDHKQNLILDIYSKCSINKISRLEDFPKQHQDYLNAYLVEDLESQDDEW